MNISLYRATEEFKEGDGCCTNIDIAEFNVIRETHCYYIISLNYKEKRVYKKTMKFAQHSREAAVKALKARLATQINWWEHRIEWAKSSVRYIDDEL